MTSTATQTSSDSLAWFKSSYSGSAGGNCLEAAYDWRKSSYSSDQGGACLEVATSPSPHPTIHIRDSKNPGGPVLTLGADAWGAFVVDVAVRA
ncbi:MULTISPECIES: DUF397 domain-containing protein [Streptomyces]|uniref:DUF397 domain-containing protein n=1 Tax=Streptomyces TaxID=1883 RepID=UPI001963D183|nr:MULTISPECIES: DUF397 domain-containing protein [Streptomyces]QRX94415.1 DUF397 domain-containing protein [Streptomyces noursei]UJB44125.1 DUF397 domain-containing protein [Streptomyces sp. A1-5]